MKRILLLLTLLLTLSACKRVPLYETNSDVYIEIDIQVAVEGIFRGEQNLSEVPEWQNKLQGVKPEYVQVCFYDVTTHELVAEEFLESKGGFINLPAGTYDVILYSLGHENTQVSDNRWRGQLYAFTSDVTGQLSSKWQQLLHAANRRTASSDISDYANDPIINEPDHIFVGVKENVVIPDFKDNSEHHTVVIPVEMKTIVETYTLDIQNVIGAGNISETEVFITGQVRNRYLWDHHYSPSPATIFFTARRDESRGNVYSVFNTFGKFPGVENEVILNILVTDVTGSQYKYVFNVTDQFDNPDNNRHQIIINEEITIPEPGSGGGGLNPSVDPWGDEKEDIDL